MSINAILHDDDDMKFDGIDDKNIKFDGINDRYNVKFDGIDDKDIKFDGIDDDINDGDMKMMWNLMGLMIKI